MRIILEQVSGLSLIIIEIMVKKLIYVHHYREVLKLDKITHLLLIAICQSTLLKTADLQRSSRDMTSSSMIGTSFFCELST